MHRIPGENIGEICYVDEVDENSFEIPYICEYLLRDVEKKIGKLVKDAGRRVRTKSLEYTTPDGKVFLRIRFKDKSLRLIMPGNEITFVDRHSRTKALPVPEWGEGNVEFEMKNISQVDIVEEYLHTSLALVDFYEPSEEDVHPEEEYVLELTDGKYDGPVVDGKPHGMGKFTWSDGSTYEGSFVNGNVEGKGKYTRANGDTFDAMFSKGRISPEAPEKQKEEKPAQAPGSMVFTFGYIF